MRDHEIELISALIEGRLDDETEARALIASSPRLQAEYEAQRMSHDALRSAGTTSMREDERTAMHRDVWAALRAGQAPPARARWFYRLVPAGVGVVVIGVAALAVLSQAGEDAGEDTAFVAADSAETTAAASVAEEPTAGTTEGATDLTATEELAASESERFASTASALRQRDDAMFDETGEIAADGEAEACLDDAGLEDYLVLTTLDESQFFDSAAGDGDTMRLIAAIPPDADLETAPITFLDLDTCEPVYVDG